MNTQHRLTGFVCHLHLGHDEKMVVLVEYKSKDDKYILYPQNGAALELCPACYKKYRESRQNAIPVCTELNGIGIGGCVYCGSDGKLVPPNTVKGKNVCERCYAKFRFNRDKTSPNCI